MFGGPPFVYTTFFVILYFRNNLVFLSQTRADTDAECFNLKTPTSYL